MRRERENRKRGRGREGMILRRRRERDEHREGTDIDRVVRRRQKKIFFRLVHKYFIHIKTSSQIVHGRTVRSSPIFGYVCGLGQYVT